MNSEFSDYKMFTTNLQYLPLLESIFGGASSTKDPNNEPLGEGYSLQLIEASQKPKSLEYRTEERYGYLFKDGVPISATIFRKGGSCNGFKDGYCSLIQHQIVPDTDSEIKGALRFSYGSHCIVNAQGEIALNGGEFSKYPCHIKGHIGAIEQVYYDLRTGEAILKSSSSNDILRGATCMYIEHRYPHRDSVIPTGIYTINYETAIVTKIDEIK